MENASKALLMAASVLIGIILISLMVIMFMNSGNVSSSYDKTISQEEISVFNSNFTKYVGRGLTIHEVKSIINFAKANGVKVDSDVTSTINISNTLSGAGGTYENTVKERKYKLVVLAYDTDTGKISKIQITT